MSSIKVLVAATSPDIKAAGIAAAVAARSDMTLAESRVVMVAEIAALLEPNSHSGPRALVLVGPQVHTEEPAARWLDARPDLVIVRVDAPIGDVVRFATQNIGLSELLSELRALIDRAAAAPQKRVAHFQLRAVSALGGQGAEDTSVGRTALNTAMDWIHVVLRSAVSKLTAGNGDLPGLTLSAATVADFLDAKPARAAADMAADVKTADAELSRVLAANDAQFEPLVRAARVFRLSAMEVRLLLLALAPELDSRYQRCMGLLLDDMGRRVGTIGLCATLLGEPSQVRHELAQSGNLERWRVLDGHPGILPPADEPLRLDPSIVGWLFGNDSSLRYDRHARRAMRLAAWPGRSLLDGHAERAHAAELVDRLRGEGEVQWLVLGSADSAGWRALLELGAEARQAGLVRVDAARLAGIEVDESEECGVRLGRMARLTESALVIDATSLDGSAQEDDALRVFLAAVARTEVRAAVISNDEARVVRLLGSMPYEVKRTALDRAARIATVRAAAAGADAYFTEAAADAVATQYSLGVNGLEQAMRLARGRPLAHGIDDPRATRFMAACKDVAAEGISSVAERIEPIFGIDDVVLPPDRKDQLIEIVDSIRLAPKVLDGWKFREQLPYGRGVTALFHGPSGTGKTMAAMAVAKKLGVQILRLDLSRVVSKYIGDTEKNIDRVFVDAQRSGSAILIDEADALFGKRSEVKDAHDRYANIEVAFLLQRMEAYEGLAILTTNLRQNLDPAFLRRLRFIVDFPRPDTDAREKIWRRCLPEESHALNDAAFRQLARRIDLTGGHIRQITLRAAFIAAASDTPIGIEHIAHACRAELAKLGMPPMEIEPAERRNAA